ncbi:MAG: DUF502 domain-containing protein [Planctomycetota bacterium]|nr:MAG: DUF502 domain-containing protein [Planctomycetota bacterium]
MSQFITRQCATDSLHSIRSMHSHEPLAHPVVSKSPRGQFFLRGMGVVLPSVLMLWIFVAAYRFVDSNIAEPINSGLRLVVALSAESIPLEQFLPTEAEVAAEQTRALQLRLDASTSSARWTLVREHISAWWNARWYLDLVGLVIAVVAVYALGRLVGGFLGRTLLAAFEAGLLTVPGIRQVYPALKQVVEFLFGGTKKRLDFNRVVMIEYPRAGVWSVGLVTGETAPQLVATVGDSLTVFVPSSPTPFTGWIVSVPKSQVREVDLTIDEALRYLVSAGVVVPQARPSARETPATTINQSEKTASELSVKL